MPHQCVRCGKFYEDSSDYILKGCVCGSRLFFFVKKQSVEKIKAKSLAVSDEEKRQLEKDVFEMIGQSAEEKPVVLDIESISAVVPGKYELDLLKLFKGAPIIFKIEDGKYIIDIAETFARMTKKK